MITVGIDIGKYKHEASVMNDRGKFITPSIKFTNTQEGANHLLGSIRSLQAKSKEKQIRIALEATGHYWINLYDWLSQYRDLKLIVLNPLQSKALRNLNIRGIKTDEVDAKSIARVVYLEAQQEQPKAQEIYATIRHLSRFRILLTQQISEAKRQIIVLLDRIFPEFNSFFVRTFGKVGKELLKNYTTPEEVASLSITKLTNIVHKYSNGRIRKEEAKVKAKEIHNKAQNSFGTNFAQDTFSFQIKLFLKQIELLEEQRKSVEQELKEKTKELKEVQLINTIPGISDILASTILGEIGSIQRFPKAQKLVAYAGLDTKVVQSGEFEGTRTKLSKRGSPYLRWALYQAAGVARVHDQALKTMFERKKKQGKHYGIAVSAVAHKLTHIIYSVLKNQKPYQCHLKES